MECADCETSRTQLVSLWKQTSGPEWITRSWERCLSPLPVPLCLTCCGFTPCCHAYPECHVIVTHVHMTHASLPGCCFSNSCFSSVEDFQTLCLLHHFVFPAYTSPPTLPSLVFGGDRNSWEWVTWVPRPQRATLPTPSLIGAAQQIQTPSSFIFIFIHQHNFISLLRHLWKRIITLRAVSSGRLEKFLLPLYVNMSNHMNTPPRSSSFIYLSRNANMTVQKQRRGGMDYRTSTFLGNTSNAAVWQINNSGYKETRAHIWN